MKFKSLLLPQLIGLLIPFYALTANCQSKKDTLSSLYIEKIEESINKKENLQQLKQELDVLKQQAAKVKDDIMFCRSLRDLIAISDLRTEDTLYFRNSAVLDTLIDDPKTRSDTRSILYILQAQRLVSINHYFRFNQATYRTKDLKHDYGALTQIQRDSLSVEFLKKALINKPFKADASRLLWISLSPDVFLFEPKFEDIVLSELINLTAKNYYEYHTELTNQWLSLPSEKFRALLDSLGEQPGHYSNFFKYYHQWISFHEKDAEAAMFIESLARKQLYMSSTRDSLTEQIYNKYLAENITSPYPAFRAHIIYQLCLAWNADGNKYPDFLHPSYGYTGNVSQYQYYHVKALQLYREHQDLLAKYPAFNNVLMIMAAQILKKGLRVEIADKLPADKDLPFKLYYKNTDSLFYRIVRLNAGEDFEDHAGHGFSKTNTRFGIIQHRDGMVPPALLNRTAVISDKFIVPLPADHNGHAVYLKLAALPAGNYGIIFSDKVIGTADTSVHGIAFKVTNITAINADERVYILNRKTGQPLAGADVWSFKKGIALPGVPAVKTSEGGYVTLKSKDIDSLQIIYKGDTLAYNISIQTNNLPDGVYDKDKYDDLADFYDDKLKMEVFTDRSIYRPGQTVQYKAIFLTHDPNTGETVLFNRATLGDAGFNKWLKEKKPVITIEDPFNRVVDSIKLNINGFGSLAGTYILPKAAATGEWRINGSPDNDYSNNGNFRVEEYKRPTIELNVQKQTKMLVPGQPFVIKLKLRSFTGADLGNIPISYTLNRDGSVPVKNKPGGDYQNVVIVKTKGFTDSNGELEVTVNDTALLKYRDNPQFQYYNYNLNATAVDETGESTAVRENISITSRPVRISINVDKIVDRQNLKPLIISTTNDFEGNIARMVDVKLYRVSDPSLSTVNFIDTDQWYYTPDQWNAWFPELAYKKPLKKADPVLVLDTTINTATNQKLLLPAAKLSVGFYEISATSKDGDKIIGQYGNTFTVFDSKEGKVPGSDIDYLPVTAAKPGEDVTWYSSGKVPTYTIYQAVFEAGSKPGTVKNIYEEVNQAPGVKKWVFHIPADATGNISLSRVLVVDNQIYKVQKTVAIIKPVSENPEIIIERYRKVMAPGEQESFTVSIKTKNENIAAELMTTLYDASLDKLQPHQWNLPQQSYSPPYYPQWNYTLKDNTTAGDGIGAEDNLVVMRETRTVPGAMFAAVQGRAAGLSVTSSNALDEVVITGSEMKRSIAMSSEPIMLRGNNINNDKHTFVVLNGKIYTGDLNSISASGISQVMVLKGAEATALYGSKATDGVLIISTNGPIVLPGDAEPVIKIRKDFNETAFFFPQVHASADGYYHFSFTMPQTATEWNWKLLAQTKDAHFAYLERKLQTQLNLMVQPNVPRLLYQGDQVKLKSRISNLDILSAAVKAVCKIEDVVTGEDLTSALAGNNTQNIRLDKKSTGEVSFLITVPAGQLHPLKIVISAQTATASDAEEHIIPVLSSRIFIRQGLAVSLKNNPSLNIPTVNLPVDATPFGVGISITQKPQAALINALPWLANYSYDCAEQTFNKLRALTTALNLMRTDSIARESYKAASLAVKTDKPADNALPDELAEESMPWLNRQNQTLTRQKQLFKLFDTTATKMEMNKHFERLYKLQQPDNGLAWFDGGQSNAYISAYVLAGFGQLEHNGWKADTRQNTFINNLTAYVQTQFLKDGVRNNDMDLLYALSYGINQNDESAKLTDSINSALNYEWKNVNNFNLEQQALLIINTLRCIKANDPLTEKAKKQLASIRQLAIEDEQNGIRWKDIADSEQLNSSAEETVAVLAEAFEAAGENKDVDPGIIKWILTAKQDDHWQTTKGTAAAINLLQKVKGGAFEKTKAMSAVVNGQPLAVSDNLLTGTPDAFASVKQFPSAISLQQQGANAQGYITWYYFAEPTQADTLNKGISLKKQFYIEDKAKGWVELQPGTVLNAGDKVKVKLTIETTSKLSFVHISDPRAAAFEPADNKSGYQYNNGFSYYQSIKDTGLDIFTELIPRGISEVDYELVVAMSGKFTGGPVKLQCLYNPSAVAYGTINKFNVN